MKICTVDPCGTKAVAKGFCNRHYQRWYKYGDPLAGAAAPAAAREFSDDDRALALVARGQQREEDQALLREVGFLQGESVVCRREAPAAGSWPRFDGKAGKVVAFTIQRFASLPPYVEIGVTFTGGGYPDAWFKPDELEAVA